MKMLIACFLAVMGTAIGTVVFEGAVQHSCQVAFLVAASGAFLLLISGYFK